MMTPRPTPISSGAPRAKDPDAASKRAALLAEAASLQAEGRSLAESLSPRRLAAADLVLASYTALTDDVHNAESTVSEVLSAGLSAGAASPDDSVAATPVLIAALREFLSSPPHKLGLFDRGAHSGPLRLRTPKKYRVVPSGLLGVAWWRLALDEAQAIDSPVSAAAEMARKLFSAHRWCVSGTPFARSAADLCGLLRFLSVPPYDEPNIFTRFLLAPSTAGSVPARARLLSLAHAVMWRTRMEDVRQQLGIPPLTTEVVPIAVTRTEGAFAKAEFGKFANVLSRLMQTWRREEVEERARRGASGGGGGSDAWVLGGVHLTPAELEIVSAPLLRLRQVLVHPALVLGEGGAVKRERGEGGERGVLSLSDAMRALVEKTAAECEALQRELVFSLHGQASLRLLLGETSAAAALYHRVIGFARAEAAAGPRTGPGLAAWLAGPGKNGTLRLDALQHIHALHNLLEVHKTVAAGGGGGRRGRRGARFAARQPA